MESIINKVNEFLEERTVYKFILNEGCYSWLDVESDEVIEDNLTINDCISIVKEWWRDAKASGLYTDEVEDIESEFKFLNN